MILASFQALFRLESWLDELTAQQGKPTSSSYQTQLKAGNIGKPMISLDHEDSFGAE